MGKRKKPRKKKSKPQQKTPKRREVNLSVLKEILARTKEGALGDEDREQLDSAIETLAYLTQELEAKGASIRRLRKMIFGANTEKTSMVLDDDSKDTDPESNPESEEDNQNSDESPSDSEDSSSAEGESTPNGDTPAENDKKKRKGHGRNGADKYTGAKKEKHSHESLKPGDHCPECLKGKVYRMPKPKTLVRVDAMAPLDATVYEMERLRCNLCGEIFTAKPPPGVGDQKYNETAASMIGLLKYGSGLPFNRLERLQQSLGIPLPASTQWDLVAAAEELIAPAYEELIRQAAQGDVLHNDDTNNKVLTLMGKWLEEVKAAAVEDMDEDGEERTGIFTTGIVSVKDKLLIALFFTGRKHAGENLEDVLARRAAELGSPIQMCDALSRNTCGDFETIVANCIAHARRKFVDVVEDFPEECRYVIETLREVYKFDAETKQQQMSDLERLSYHQEHSGPLMDGLYEWATKQQDNHLVEENSGLGEALKYMTKHWSKLTLFLQVPGAPLDNNAVERAIKKAILHRRNSLFYKTENGARVGDTYMSLIYTAELHGINPFRYLVALQKHHDEVARNPSVWMPWNYENTMEDLSLSTGLPE
jgi:hypothetical protein